MPSRTVKRLAAAVVAACALVLPGQASAADSVRMWEHANYQGASFVPADTQLDFRKIDCWLWWCANWNDRVSSLHVPAYTCVTLHEHINLGGADSGERFCGFNVAGQGAARDFPYVGTLWNDRASSSVTVGRRIIQG
jgi:hypothetical protein